MLTAEPKAYGSNWYATTRVDSPRRPQLSVELDVEVCVIGAGLAGLTLAREVARLGWSVVVLEAKSIAWSASGRGLGVVAPGFSTGVDALIERVGLDAAKALWERSEAGAEYVRTAARGLPGVALNEGGWLHVSRTDRTAELAHEAALLVGEFGQRLAEIFGARRKFWGRRFCLQAVIQFFLFLFQVGIGFGQALGNFSQAGLLCRRKPLFKFMRLGLGVFE